MTHRGHFQPLPSVILSFCDSVFCPPGCPGTLLAPVEPVAGQHLQIPFCRAALQPSSLSLHLCLSLLHPRCRLWRGDLVDFIPVIITQTIQIPLQGILSFRRVNSTSQFGIVSNLADGAFNFCIQIINKYI